MRFAILQCAEDSDYVKKKYRGYLGVYLRMQAEEGEIWEVFHVADGDFPDTGEIGGYDGFVITGSCKDAYGDDDWICELLNLLNKLHLMNKKILGICFGHQKQTENMKRLLATVSHRVHLQLITCARDVWLIHKGEPLLASSNGNDAHNLYDNNECC